MNTYHSTLLHCLDSTLSKLSCTLISNMVSEPYHPPWLSSTFATCHHHIHLPLQAHLLLLQFCPDIAKSISPNSTVGFQIPFSHRFNTLGRTSSPLGSSKFIFYWLYCTHLWSTKLLKIRAVGASFQPALLVIVARHSEDQAHKFWAQMNEILSHHCQFSVWNWHSSIS